MNKRVIVISIVSVVALFIISKSLKELTYSDTVTEIDSKESGGVLGELAKAIGGLFNISGKK